MAKKSSVVSLVGRVPDVPPNLAERGAAFWRDIHREFVIGDRARCELVGQAASAIDRLAAIEDTLAREGMMVTTHVGTTKPHPLLALEAQNRAIVARCLKLLGLVDQPIRGVGRPSSPIGWRGG